MARRTVLSQAVTLALTEFSVKLVRDWFGRASARSTAPRPRLAHSSGPVGSAAGRPVCPLRPVGDEAQGVVQQTGAVAEVVGDEGLGAPGLGLASGKVTPAETADWYLARDKDGFVLPDDVDAFVASGYALSPADCERGIETEPVTSLPYDALADERPFCVRGADGRRLVLARLVTADRAGGPVTVELSQYRREG